MLWIRTITRRLKNSKGTLKMTETVQTLINCLQDNDSLVKTTKSAYSDKLTITEYMNPGDYNDNNSANSITIPIEYLKEILHIFDL
jgi:hypothetical protein